MKIGAQLYTVREYTRNLNDFSDTLKKIADIGYTEVQVSGTCEFDPQWLKNELDKNGLTCVVTHTPPARIINEPEKVAEEHKIFGCRYCGIGWNAFNLSEGDTPEKFIEKYLPAAEKLSEHGVMLMYHNHDQEFQKIDEKYIIDILARDFPEDKMGFILDTFWIQAAGEYPPRLIKRFERRIPCIHIKEFAYGRKFAPIGEGNLKWEPIFSAAANSGVEHMLVEQDDCYGEDPFDCLRRSYNFLKSYGFE